MNISSIHTILSLLQLRGIGPAYIGKHELKIKEALESQMDLKSLVKTLSKTEYTAIAIAAASDQAYEIIELANRSAVSITDLFDASYPQKLKENGIKWPVIYTLGKLELEKKAVGIIGSREATAIGIKIAYRLGEYFAQQDFAVVNGIAKGIDVAGISAPLAQSNAIGVVPGGLDINRSRILSRDYLEEANKLLEAGGTLISAYAPNKKQDQYTVVEYCKLQAALSDALILVQSRLGGGSRFTVGAFSLLNRPLGIVNASKYDSKNKNCYSTNDLLLEKGKIGLSEYCEIDERKINCTLIPIEDRADYPSVLKAIPAIKRQAGFFDE